MGYTFAAVANILRGGRFKWSTSFMSGSFYKTIRSCNSQEIHTTGNHFQEYSKEKETHFGYETVKENVKAEKVHSVFKSVAASYDCMNDAMSFGIHRIWKDIFMHRLGPTPGTKLLDVAGGTGDIAFRFLRYVEFDDVYSTEISEEEFLSSEDIDTGGMKLLNSSASDRGPKSETILTGPSHVTVCDINRAMLEVGKRRAEKLGYAESISWVEGDAERLPFASESFDAYTIAFGIRNVVHVDKVLREAYRVLRPGGRFMCLEFSQVENKLLQWLYDQYSFQMIPVMGQLIAGDWKSYQYLVESIRKFPNQEEFLQMINAEGFQHSSYENLSCGVVAIHSGFKL